MTPVRLEPEALRSRVKHSAAEPLRSHSGVFVESFLHRYMYIFGKLAMPPGGHAFEGS